LWLFRLLCVVCVVVFVRYAVGVCNNAGFVATGVVVVVVVIFDICDIVGVVVSIIAIAVFVCGIVVVDVVVWYVVGLHAAVLHGIFICVIMSLLLQH